MVYKVEKLESRINNKKIMNTYTHNPLKSFTQLDTWKIAHELILSLYTMTKKFPQDELFGLTNQIRRSAVSISSNITEGFGRKSLKEKIQFYSISLGSLYETQNQILIARDLGYISSEDFSNLSESTIQISKLLHGLIKKTRLMTKPTKQDSGFRIPDSRF